MASLKFIMDVNDDHHTDVRHTNKKDDTPANTGQLPRLEEAANTPPLPGHVSSSSGLVFEHQQQQHNISQTVPNIPQTNKRRGASARGPKSTTTLPAPLPPSSAAIPSISSPSLSLPGVPASASRPPARRRSTASVDSMDQTGYGSGVPSSSMGGFHHSNNQPMRPMPPHLQVSEMPTRLTPITGRVSRAKKGIPVHVCELCKPPKTFTRAEHLRRHQLSHQTPGYACTYPGCERAFHRPDLLARHQQRHDVEGDKASKAGGNEEGRRASSTRSSMDDGYSQRSSLQPSGSGSSSAMLGPGAGSIASTSSTDLSSAPNISADQRRFSQMSSSTGSPAMPRAMGSGNTGAYRSSGGGSRDYNSYSMPSSTVSIIDPTHHSTISGSFSGMMDYQTPRTAAQNMNMMSTLPTLPHLLIPEENKPPELGYGHDHSPWTSSASDSTYSTPVSDIPRRAWMPRQRSPAADWPSNSQLLSPYPGSAPRNLQNPSGGMESMPAPSMYVNNQFSTSSYTHTPAPQQSFYDVSMNPYGSATAQGQHSGPYRTHQHSASISSLSSPIQAPNTSSHSGETLVAPAAHAGRVDSLMGLGRQKELAMGTHHGLFDSQTGMGGLGVLGGMGVGFGAAMEDPSRHTGDHDGGILTALDLPMSGGCSMPGPGVGMAPRGAVRAAIPGYLDVYWNKAHPILPVVHRQSFEAAPEEALRCAMAAVATQYLPNKEDRTRGNQLHEYAWHEAKRVTGWSLQTMQAILLLEYFARFRGRKAVTKPSKLFESLYSRFLYHNPAFFNSTVLDADPHLTAEERWRSWLDTEARRRLLAGCFHLDGHAATYQQQPRAHDFDADGMTPIPPVPLFAGGSVLWEANSADKWTSILTKNPEAGILTFALSSEQLTPEYVTSQGRFDRMAILGTEILRLPRRQPPHSSPDPENNLQLNTDPRLRSQNSQQSAFVSELPSYEIEEHISRLFIKCPVGNTYLALHHTPLQDLLAVGGDSWVFAQKVLPASSFQEHQKRLKLWAEQPSRPSSAGNNVSTIGHLNAARATVYAARAILRFLECGPGSSWSADVSDYWALYVCALICWAFGHRVRPTPGTEARNLNNHQRHSGTGSVPNLTTAKKSGNRTASADDEAISWLQVVADESTRLEDVVRMRTRREGGAVVGLVLRRLENDCVGGRSRLYVDAVGVLRKLDEGANWKWF